METYPRRAKPFFPGHQVQTGDHIHHLHGAVSWPCTPSYCGFGTKKRCANTGALPVLGYALVVHKDNESDSGYDTDS